jgi:hypothetical protein
MMSSPDTQTHMQEQLPQIMQIMVLQTLKSPLLPTDPSRSILGLRSFIVAITLLGRRSTILSVDLSVLGFLSPNMILFTLLLQAFSAWRLHRPPRAPYPATLSANTLSFPVSLLSTRISSIHLYLNRTLPCHQLPAKPQALAHSGQHFSVTVQQLL